MSHPQPVVPYRDGELVQQIAQTNELLAEARARAAATEATLEARAVAAESEVQIIRSMMSVNTNSSAVAMPRGASMAPTVATDGQALEVRQLALSNAMHLAPLCSAQPRCSIYI